jgi:MHS family proline/betaine transporter-like MFS transporter
MKLKSKQTFAIVAGHLFEHYDICLYGFFAVILAPVFFPPSSVYAAQIASFGAFAAGFLMRPLGGFIFGNIGDRYGRKKALLVSISLAALPTLLIGLLPTYDSIGLAAPILLVIFRLLQGVSIGGEYSGAIIYIFEHSQQKQPVLKAGLLLASGYVGAGIGTIVGMLCTSSFMPSWGWRIPFILGGVMGMAIYWMRRGMQETPEFKAISDLNLPTKHPLNHVFALNKKEFFCCIIFASTMVPFYLAVVYINAWLTELGLTRSEILLDNMVIIFSSGLLIPLMGSLADRFGSLKFITFGFLIFALFSVPVFISLTSNPSWQKCLILQTFLILPHVCILAPLTSFLPTLFPVAHRYTGISVSYTLGQAIFGGLTPLLAALLTSSTGQRWAPSLLLCGASILFLICLRLCQKPRLSASPSTLNSDDGLIFSTLPLPPSLNKATMARVKDIRSSGIN